MTEKIKKRPWLIRVHYAMRTMSFTILFIAAGAQIIDKEVNVGLWAFLFALFIIYPHFQYWRVCRSKNPVKEEIQNLITDSVLLGAFIVSIQFSQWIAFSAVVGTLINNVMHKGWRGVPETAVSLSAGVGIGILVWGFTFLPYTNPIATIFCIICITTYILAIGHLGYSRNIQLRSAREKLQSRERELIDANDSLKQNLQEIDELQKQLQNLANRDPLTGLYNRRYLDSTLGRELARCQRDKCALAVILCDIDYFKKINDTYGHPTGDEILKQLSSLLGIIVRSSDVACRYGGEEFLLLLPNMPLAVAKERAEKLRQIFADTILEFGELQLHSTISVGVAVYPEHGKNASDIIASADRALYKAKAAGRNCVMVED